MKGLFVLAAAAAPALAVDNAPVQKVMQLIGELKVKVQKDLKAEAGSMSEYSTFCDDEQSAKGYAIQTAAREMDGFQAVIEDTTGQMQDLQSTISTASSEQAAKSQELKSATSVRDNEHADYAAAEKELVESVDTLSRAVTIIKREMSFVQGGKKGSKGALQQKLSAMSGALNQIIAAAWIDASSRSKLKNFLTTDMDDELTLRQPQATVKSYESHSKGIVDVLGDMKDKAESALSNLRREEMQAKHAFEMIKQSLTDSTTVLSREISESQMAASAAGEKLGKAQGDLETTTAAKTADEEYLSKLTAECKSKAAEWEERQVSARQEIEALDKGLEILNSHFGAFVQQSKGVDNDAFAARDKVVSVLKKLGRQYKSFGLITIANAAKKDPFAKVRGLIESMIAKLQTQAADEATHEAFCKEETVKSKKTKETKKMYVDRYQSRIDEAKATHAELKGEIATLQSELREIAESNKKATAMRTQEAQDYAVASKDYKESGEAITQALVVLKDFYKSGEALLQTGTNDKQAPEFGESRSDASHMIIEILQVAQEDFSRLLAEAETTEAEAKEAYKTLMQENKVAAAKKETAIKNKTSEAKTVEVSLTHHKQDWETVSAELDAVTEYLEKLKPQCENKAMTYEERKARREAEVAGLQEALTILEGEDIAAFIQKRGFLQKKL
jgi:chromosome segregation ATPase